MSIKVGVIGAGAMGTAVAQTVAPNASVLLYARREEICETINKTHVNSQYFPNVQLHENIVAVNDFNDFNDVEIVFLCIHIKHYMIRILKLLLPLRENAIASIHISN